ncbi:MAG: hypothetical protein M0Q38_12780 [Bacteroidales bacterium]|nr:hypothetical protein [Bacteroidales bacterium]
MILIVYRLNATNVAPAGRSAGFTCSFLCLRLSFAGSVNASLRKHPVLLG